MRKSRHISLKGKTKVAVVGDGKCESWYIQMLKRNERSIGIDIKPEIPQRKKLSDQYDKVIDLNQHYDKVFWIVDLDVVIKETQLTRKGERTALAEFKAYYKRIENINKESVTEKIKVIINNPCLEFWLLLHFESTSKYFDACEGAIKRIKKHLRDYEKSEAYYTKQDKDIYLRLKPFLTTALLNAGKMGPIDLNNPYSGISQMQFLFEEVMRKVE